MPNPSVERTHNGGAQLRAPSGAVPPLAAAHLKRVSRQHPVAALSESSIPAHIKAHTTGRWAEIIFRALSARVAARWQFVSFRGANKAEWRGVVDVIAIRKNSAQPLDELLKRGDLFDIVLIQIKGGSARGPTESDCLRLREVKRLYRAKAVVQFQWRKGVSSEFFVLGRNLKWTPTTSQALFR